MKLKNVRPPQCTLGERVTVQCEVQPSRHPPTSVACARPKPGRGSLRTLLELHCALYDTPRSVSSLFEMVCRGQAPTLARVVMTSFFFGVTSGLGRAAVYLMFSNWVLAAT